MCFTKLSSHQVAERRPICASLPTLEAQLSNIPGFGAIRALWLGSFVATLAPSLAAGHPHVWIQVRDTFHFDAAGRIDSVLSEWWFDDVYSAAALAGLDRNRDGTYTTAELKTLHDDMWSNFPKRDYFTMITVNGKAERFGRGASMTLSVDGAFLKLDLLLPLSAPFDPQRSRVELRSLDATYFAALDLVPEEPVRLAGAVPTRCRAEIDTPQDDSEETPLSDDRASDQKLALSYAMNAATAVRIACS